LASSARLEETLIRLFGVEIFSDVYERLSRMPLPYIRGLARNGVPKEIIDSRVVFIHIPKNAGTSINSCFYGKNIGHRSAEFYRATCKDILRQKLFFAVLRDPLERFASAAKMFLDDRNADIKVHPRIRRHFGDITTTEDILRWAEEGIHHPYRVDVIFRPQSWFVLSTRGEMLVDCIFLLGRDESALAKFVLEHTGKQRFNKNRSSNSLHLTATQQERIRRVYATDFALIERFKRR
jgi:hypothetical protein